MHNNFISLAGGHLNGVLVKSPGSVYIEGIGNEPTSFLVQPLGAHCCEVMYFGFRGELSFLNCDDVVVVVYPLP